VRKAILTAVVFAMLATACGGQSSSDSADLADEPGDLFVTDFEQACGGVGIGAARPYSPGGQLNELLAFSGEEASYARILIDFAGGWTPITVDVGSIELVLCLDRVSQNEGELCDGYTDDDSGSEWSIQTFAVDYDVKLREAATGEVVAETSLSAEAGSCPRFSAYIEGTFPDPRPDYAIPDVALEEWLDPYLGT